MIAATEELVVKYDRLAATYSSRYRDPGAIAARQLALALRWGAPPPQGGRVLELGCSDGFVTAELARAGFGVTAVDLSPGMVAAARERLLRQGLAADFRVTPVEAFRPEARFDVTLGLMWTFFGYLHDPVPVLRRLADGSNKVLVDVNPRQLSVRAAVHAMRAAGFRTVDWRPFFLPQRVRVPGALRTALEIAERIPVLRSVPLRWKFTVVLKGES